jgi:hypothetical protein
MGGDYKQQRKPPVHQPDAVIAQANPGTGVQYPVLAALTPNPRIISLAISCTWTIQPTPLEAHFIIDGNAITHTIANPASAVWHEASLFIQNAPAAQNLNTPINVSQYRAFLYEGRAIGVTAEITGGTVQNLDCRIKWAQYQ